MVNETVFLGGCPIIKPEGIYYDGRRVIRLGLGIANPASENCVAKGGTMKIAETPAGQSGVCVFPDGSECEEWAFFHGACAPGKKDGSSSQIAGVVVGAVIGTAVVLPIVLIARGRR